MANNKKSIVFFRDAPSLFAAFFLAFLFLLPGLLVDLSYSAFVNFIIAIILKIIIPIVFIIMYCRKYPIREFLNDSAGLNFFRIVYYATLFSLTIFGVKIALIWDDGSAWTQQIALPALLFSHIIFLHFIVIIFWLKILERLCAIPFLRMLPIFIISFSSAILFVVDEHYFKILDKYIYLYPKYEMNFFSMLFSHLRGGALN